MERRNQTALITGSGRKRVGYVVAKHLAQQGYDIAIHYHSSKEQAGENARELTSLGVDAKNFQADVTSEEEVARLIKDVTRTFGTIDVLVTTSSIWKSIRLEQVTADDVLNSFRVNTLGTFLSCQLAGLQMVSQETGGSIITIGDALIGHPYIDHAAYFTAKGSIPTLTRSLAVELGSRNAKVRVNCIEPGPVMFPDGMPEGKRQSRIDSTLTKVAGQPESVAKTVSFLLDNSMLTGCCIPLDGGRNVALEHYHRTQPR